jgi:hypothetical protein
MHRRITYEIGPKLSLVSLIFKQVDQFAGDHENLLVFRSKQWAPRRPPTPIFSFCLKKEFTIWRRWPFFSDYFFFRFSNGQLIQRAARRPSYTFKTSLNYTLQFDLMIIRPKRQWPKKLPTLLFWTIILQHSTWLILEASAMVVWYDDNASSPCVL